MLRPVMGHLVFFFEFCLTIVAQNWQTEFKEENFVKEYNAAPSKMQYIAENLF